MTPRPSACSPQVSCVCGDEVQEGSTLWPGKLREGSDRVCSQSHRVRCLAPAPATAGVQVLGALLSGSGARREIG